jgi:hypothetical protein
LLGALVTAAVAAFVLAAYGGSSAGAVVAKTDQGVYDYAFERGAVDVADTGRRPRSGRLRMSG